jgi:UDP:flavonoid glycosyltransferase YjiC (YdhE family)
MPPVKVSAVQRDVESLIKLLGGTADQRLRFWEIVKGITTPAEFRAATRQIERMQKQVGGMKEVAQTLKQTAGKVNR